MLLCAIWSYFLGGFSPRLSPAPLLAGTPAEGSVVGALVGSEFLWIHARTSRLRLEPAKKQAFPFRKRLFSVWLMEALMPSWLT